MTAVATEFPREVVTRSLVRYLDVPGSAGEFALITLDNGHDHTRPSTFGPAGLASLATALDQIEARSPAVSAVGITGKPFVFAAGADLGGVALLQTRPQALAIARAGHAVFARLRALSVPTFAFLNGVTLGGGLELALHCDYRTISRSAGAVAFPECFLGLVPGWGGTQLLPALIGPAAAVTVIVENALNQNKMLSASDAANLGIADELLDSADFLAESLRWAGRVIEGSVSVARAPLADEASYAAAVARGRMVADARVHGAAPAPYRALELIEQSRTLEFAAGTAAEDDALADLIMTDELRSGLYAFDLVNRRAKRPAGAPDKALARPVTTVGIVGAGLMASQLALLFVRRLRVPVMLTDLDSERLDRGVSWVHAEIAKLRERGRLGQDEANRLTALVTGTLERADFAAADFVIEAVFEQLAVKQQVFGELEKYLAPTAVLATNTSSLSVSAMARDLQYPERVVGFHFFNPVAVLPLLEIVRGERTDEATLATAFAVAGTLKKSSVLVSDAPAFVVNRLLTRFMGEITAAVDEGTPIEVADGAMAPLGLPMSPFALLGLVGPAIGLHVAETLHEAFGERFPVSSNLRRLVAAGRPSIYLPAERGDRTARLDPAAEELFELGDRASTSEQVRDRALAALADEIARMLDEHVVDDVRDIDLGLILGAGWPFHLGGISPYLDRAGVSERVTGRRFLPPGVASAPSV
ncbi:MAG: 3-hydroxyacyl-CoA dehydrogenase NAD-binding [Frankiales bacterium]|nr:3-hydroxyacyl-CoA dehydrogenase NAD-binding [Frankiales bacterium]